MVKKYYCDYCDRSLTDNAENRRKHLEGVQHQNNVKLHYDSYKDPVELLLENSKNPTCRKFKDDGYCPYGLSCKYSHVPKGIDFTYVDPHYYLAHNPHLLQRQPITQEDYRKWHQPPVQNVKYKLPPGLTKNLPPSLRPPPPNGYDFSHAAQWG